MEELNLAWNGFHLRGCMAIGHALKHNNSLLALDLTCNRISELCLAQLLKGIKDNTSLTTLKVSSRKEWEGAKEIDTGGRKINR